LRCSGSSLFLKNRFGAGYALTLAKSDANSKNDDIVNLVKEYIPDAKLASAVAGEVELTIPLESSSSFASLFNQLKLKAKDLNVSSYGVSITTLEQVFISLAKEDKKITDLASADDYDDVSQQFVFHAVWNALASMLHIITNVNSGVESRWVKAAQRDPDEQLHSSAVSAALPPPAATTISSQAVIPVPIHESIETDLEAPIFPVSFDESVVSDLEATNEIIQDAIIDSGDNSHMIEMQNSGAPNHANQSSGGIELTRIGDPPGGERIDKADDSHDYAQGDALIQLGELLRKRAVIQSRDANGLFFQIIFPALQILLILAILTVTLNPAGRTLVLNAGSFPSHPFTFYSWGSVPAADSVEFSQLYMPDLLSDKRQTLQNASFINSSKTMSQ
jgi:hypothetical protein